jgi:hypothetical protein
MSEACILFLVTVMSVMFFMIMMTEMFCDTFDFNFPYEILIKDPRYGKKKFRKVWNPDLQVLVLRVYSYKQDSSHFAIVGHL